MRGLLVLPVLLALASPAAATGEIVCGDGKGVSVDLLVSHLWMCSSCREFW